MTERLVIYWFPLILGVGFAATLLGPTRGRVMALLAALYWILLANSSTEGHIWSDPLSVILILAGATVILWVGYWMGSPLSTGAGEKAMAAAPATEAYDDWTNGELIGDLIQRFDEWLAANRHKSDPWPDFGEFIRSAIYMGAGGKHVRAFRVVEGEKELSPLRQTDPCENGFPSPRSGIIGHVITSGRAYYDNDPAHGELIDKLVARNHEPCAWCFPIRYQSRTVGVITVGETPAHRMNDHMWLRVIENLVSLFWATMAESCLGRMAGHVDPVAGVLTYDTFLSTAKDSADDAHRQGEPVVIAHISIGGIRKMYDSGEWGLANHAIAAASQVLRERVRSDDVIGVYEASQFMILLRRVDSELATLIVEQLVERLVELCGDAGKWRAELTVHCGVAGSGIEPPQVADLLIKAMNNSRLARNQSVPIVSDIVQFAEANA